MKRFRTRTSGLCTMLAASLLSFSLISCGPEDGTAFSGSPRSPDRPNQQSQDSKRFQRYQFTAGQTASESLTIDTGFGLVRQVLTLKQKAKTEERFSQLNRTIQTEQFVQGHDGDITLDNYAVAEAGLFDLLILIDDSSSMASYQDRLSHNLPNILRHISNTNWQIAVATTSSPCLAVTPSGTRIISRAQYEADPILTEHEFTNLIRIGEGGNPVERGILMATDALNGKCNGESVPWLRPDSTRSVLLLTDEHNCGSAVNEGCEGEEYATAEYFFRHAPENVTVNGLLLLDEPPVADPGNPNDPYHSCQASGGYDSLPNPSEYLRLINETGGIFGDICRSDYGELLERISLNVKDHIKNQYELTYPPVSNTLEVRLDGNSIVDFTVKGNILTINEAVSPESERLEVSYQHSPVPKRKTFQLRHNPDPKSFHISINGSALASNEYSYDPFTNELILRDMPPDRSQIKVQFRRNQPLIQAFAIGNDFVEGTMEVLVNGVVEKDVKVETFPREVWFNSPPPDNAKITLRYEMPGDKTELYDIEGINTEKLEAIHVFDRRTGEDVEAYFEGQQLRFPSNEIWDKREVVAEYDLLFEGDELKFSIPIKENIFSDSISITADGDSSLCRYDLRLTTSQLDFRCLEDSVQTIEVQYSYSEEYNNVFSLPINFVGPKKWKVEVNGEAIEHFHVFDHTVVILKDHLPAGADVGIEVEFQESILSQVKKERLRKKKDSQNLKQ